MSIPLPVPTPHSQPDAKTKISGNIDFWSDLPDEELAAAIIERMSDEELLAQTLMFGWEGLNPGALIQSWITERALGGVKIFGWNTANDSAETAADSIRTLQTLAARQRFKIPLFAATDQEGGLIRHVKGSTSITPGNLALGAGGYPVDAWKSGYYINRELNVLGINMNFAPSVDIYSDIDSSVIGTRSFGSSAEKCGILGAAFAAGSRAAGVIATAKHFPGHGATSADSHIVLPRIDIDEKTLFERELVPFKYLIEEDVEAIMSGHLNFPQLEKDGKPASLSAFFLQDILRKKLKFTGLIITDDMTMNGATSYAGSFSRAVTLAYKAGNDIIMESATAALDSKLWTDNLALMRESSDFRALIETAAKRVLLCKLRYFKSPLAAPLYPNPKNHSARLPDAEGQIFFAEAARRSITLQTFSEDSALPLAQDAKIALVSNGYSDFEKAAQKYFPNAKKNVPLSGADAVIVCVSNSADAAAAERYKNADVPVVIVSVLSPVYAARLSWASAIVYAYSYSPFSFDAAFSVIAGKSAASGTMPIELP